MPEFDPGALPDDHGDAALVVACCCMMTTCGEAAPWREGVRAFHRMLAARGRKETA